MSRTLVQKRGLDISSKDKKLLFKTEILEGLNWLANSYDEINKGWGWLPDIPVNPQNTAEVISTFISCYDSLNDEQIDILKESIDAWLVDIHVGNKYTIDYIWIIRTLALIRTHIQMFSEELLDKIDDAIVECLGYFFMSQNDDGGWADLKGDISTISRTAMVLFAMSTVTFEPTDYQRNAIDKAVNWLLKQQNDDGGWGNINRLEITNEYIRKINLSYQQLEMQYNSNPATTAYAMIALKASKPHAYKLQVMKAADYLIKTQMPDGHWELFSEFSLRNGVKSTFRHLSTTFVVEALLKTYSIDYSSEVLINAIDYLISLQDPIYKGWKSSPTSESYTWSTCNIITTFITIRDHFENIKAAEFMAIIKEWWGLKKEKEISVFKFKKSTYSFNARFGFNYCVVFTLLILTWVTISLSLFDNSIMVGAIDIAKVLKPIIVTFLTLLIGIPWTVFVKFTFKEMQNSWFESIGWVYGIIVGVLLAFYGFLI